MSYAHPYHIQPDNSMEPIPTICIQAKCIIPGHAVDNYKPLIGFTTNDFTANSTADCGNDISFDNYFNFVFCIPKRPSCAEKLTSSKSICCSFGIEQKVCLSLQFYRDEF